MRAESKFRLVDVWVGVRDPRQSTKVEHDLIELLVVAVSAVLSGADTFVEIEAWAKEKLEWLREYLKLEQGIPSHDTFGRVFAAIDPDEFGAAFVRWVGQVLPVLANGDVVAIDGKTSRRSGKVGATPLHLVSAFAAQAGVVLGQRATAKKSNEKTAIPELLATLALQGSIVTIDAMGTQPNIAQAIRDRGADYLLAVKDNQPKLAESIDDFFIAFEAAPAKTPHQFHEVVVRQHWRVENSLHWCMDVVFGDDQMRARTDHAAHNLAVVRQFVLNLIRLSPVKRKGGLKVQRLIAATSDTFRAELLGLV
ncbi:MAG: ISAs1 family transposase [Candidatus Accumulibacter necessarius]|jgi:predicted transposase YbfD/YdcC|uniref:ISAs1 family transposase n=1 Tax=Candidatus Accumulibacter necessarius TaxID=2954386 RepID=UPI002FC2D42C